ncbi:hypothetical protein B0J14DRAFT_583431 [Halenospora varia]|nr:hypothetical protein B0J14DRAFT_583431 [Halenospora varia]
MLPISPSLLQFYREHVPLRQLERQLPHHYYSLEALTEPASSNISLSLLAHILAQLNAYKASFSRYIDSRCGSVQPRSSSIEQC